MLQSCYIHTLTGFMYSKKLFSATIIVIVILLTATATATPTSPPHTTTTTSDFVCLLLFSMGYIIYQILVNIKVLLNSNVKLIESKLVEQVNEHTVVPSFFLYILCTKNCCTLHISAFTENYGE